MRVAIVVDGPAKLLPFALQVFLGQLVDGFVQNAAEPMAGSQTVSLRMSSALVTSSAVP